MQTRISGQHFISSLEVQRWVIPGGASDMSLHCLLSRLLPSAPEAQPQLHEHVFILKILKCIDKAFERMDFGQARLQGLSNRKPLVERNIVNHHPSNHPHQKSGLDTDVRQKFSKGWIQARLVDRIFLQTTKATIQKILSRNRS